MTYPTAEQICGVQEVINFITEEFKNMPGSGSDVTSPEVFQKRKDSFDRMIGKIDEAMKLDQNTIILLLPLKERILRSVQLMDICKGLGVVQESQAQ